MFHKIKLFAYSQPSILVELLQYCTVLHRYSYSLPSMAQPHVEETAATAGSVTGLLSTAQQALSSESELTGVADGANQVKASETTGAPWVVDDETLASLVSQVRHELKNGEEADETTSEIADNADEFWVQCCVKARKGNVQRASALLLALVAWKSKLGTGDSVREKTHALLRRGLIWSSGARDKNGRCVMHVRLRYADPSTFAPADVVRTVALAVEWTLRTYPCAGSHGIVILGDAGGIGLRNIDARVPRELMTAFSRTMPVRMGAFVAINLPWFIRPVFAIISKILGSKLKARIMIVGNVERLSDNFSLDAVPVDANAGGTLHWDIETQENWADAVMKQADQWPPVLPTLPN